MSVTMQGFYVNLPTTEVDFFKELVRKMGWTMTSSRVGGDTAVVQRKDLEDVPTEIRSLIGVASSISNEDIVSDDRLAYLLRK